MKGFVPVTKDSLLAMLAECREEIANQTVEHSRRRIEILIDYEKERIATRRWYRLFILPKARFAFDDESVKAYANAIEYDPFDGNPFDYIQSDTEHSLRWIDRLERVATSQHSGEPIQLDISTFMRISEPARYYWTTCNPFYSIRD